jgi:hypothetical protein
VVGRSTSVRSCSVLHDLCLLAFGVLLHDRGWRIAYLGPDTPMETLADAATRMQADCVALAALSRNRLQAVGADISQLAKSRPVAVAGAGASSKLARETGALLLSGGPVEEAARLATRIREPRCRPPPSLLVSARPPAALRPIRGQPCRTLSARLLMSVTAGKPWALVERCARPHQSGSGRTTRASVCARPSRPSGSAGLRRAAGPHPPAPA